MLGRPAIQGCRETFGISVEDGLAIDGLTLTRDQLAERLSFVLQDDVHEPIGNRLGTLRDVRHDKFSTMVGCTSILEQAGARVNVASANRRNDSHDAKNSAVGSPKGKSEVIPAISVSSPTRIAEGYSRLAQVGMASTPKAARAVPIGAFWALRDHRSMAQVIAAEGSAE